MSRDVAIVILGAGTAGPAALAQVRQSTKSFVLIGGGGLGTICARIAGMPFKAMIQIAGDFHRRHTFARLGIRGHEGLSIDVADAMEHVRDLGDIFVDRVLAGSTNNLTDEFMAGDAKFLEPTLLEVNGEPIRAGKAIIAVGARPAMPTKWERFADKILATHNLFEQKSLPRSVALIGLGSIGLEIRMGVAVTGIDELEMISNLRDPIVNQTMIDILSQEFPLWLGEAVYITEADH